MSFSPTSGQVVLKEVFDEESLATEEEIYDYALRIGIDVENEPHLLYLARDGLMQALPSGWKPCYDKDTKEIYYFNFKTKKAQWEHPLDDVYRNLVRKARNENIVSEVIDDDSRTSIREDLKSFEEASLIFTPNEMYNKPKKLEPLSPLGKSLLKKIPTQLSPIKNSNSKDMLKAATLKSALHIDEESLIHKLDSDIPHKGTVFDETEVRKRPNSSDIRNRRNIGPMEFRHLSKQEIINSQALEKFNFMNDNKKFVENKTCSESQSEIKGIESNLVAKDEGYGTEFSVSSLGERDGSGKKELTLAGGGSVFLKTNKMKFSPSSDLVTSSFSREESSEGLLSPDQRKPSDFDSHLKSILRDHTHPKIIEKIPLGAVDRKSRKDDVDEDRKSVRFNLEKELKISFEIPPVKLAVEKDTSKSDDISASCREKQEARQIEIDFDDLDICLSDEAAGEEKVPTESTKTALGPKKFRPTRMLINEFREILDNQPKNNINLMEIMEADKSKNNEPKSSRSSSRSVSSTVSGDSKSEGNVQSSQRSKPDAKVTSQENNLNKSPLTESPIKVEMTGGKIFDSAFDELVDFAIKKKLDVDSSSKRDDIPGSKISYRERDFLLEDILKETNSDSTGDESDEEKMFVSHEKELEYLEKLESQIKGKKREEFEEGIGNVEKLRNEKMNELEREYKIWLNETEESYAEKKKETSNNLKKEYESWAKEKDREFDILYRKKYEDETESRIKELKNELTRKENSAAEQLKAQLEAEQKDRLKSYKQDLEAQEVKELESLRKIFEEDLNNKKAELMKKHKEEMRKIERNLEDLLSEQKSQKLKELELVRENEAVIEAMKLEMKESYQKQKNALMKEHELLLENLKREHASVVEQIKLEFKNEEGALKKFHLNKFEETNMNSPRDVEVKKSSESIETSRSENPEARVFEKVRCEKRLLEDKYKTLKEKYIKLKTEAKSTLERKKKKKSTSVATGSESEKYSSLKSPTETNNCESPNGGRIQDKEKKLKKQINQLEYLYQDLSTEDEENLMSPKNLSYFQKSLGIGSLTRKHQSKGDDKHVKSTSNLDKSKEDLLGEEKKSEGHETKKKRQLFSRFKAVSTSKINSSNKSQGKEVLSPVENLRRQLKKLEELEDQFPVATYTDTYMRYPFTDNAQFGSSEIEFFKHRIHLERESVRRAKDSLKAQKKTFENRQRELKQKLVEGEPGSKATIDQIYQEEKELTDMEVSVYRTRALLGEKVIRLRHLEQSLKRISQPMKKGKDFLERLGVRNQAKDDERTPSDLSSYSGSSGFSSTDFNDGNNAVGVVVNKMNVEQNRRHFQNNLQESSEIIQSLENLNSEIREIWEVLKKQHQSGQETVTMLPPPPLIYGDLGWSGFTLSPPLPYRNTVITSTSNLQRPVAQQFKTQVTGSSNLRHVSAIIDSSLIDRTKSLRDWLKAARSSATSEAISSSQVTL